jgi:hypothetical protein
MVAVLAPATAQAQSVTTIATGLDNPRGLAFAGDGSLYVAEAGRGGTGPCFPGPEGGPVCFGTSGAITKVSQGQQHRVVTGLSSIANQSDGSGAYGPADVAVKSDALVYIIGLAMAPSQRDQLPPAGRNAGWVHAKLYNQTYKLADISAYEGQADPDGAGPETNPNSLAVTSTGAAVVDAAGNTLVWAQPNGTVSTLAVFPPQQVEAPPSMGLPPGTKIPVQAVPTSVVRGPDGAFYVSQLTGFPFVKGTANVFRVVPGSQPTVVASGLTNLVDLAFDRHGNLYVLEVSHNGLTSGDPTGALIKIKSDGSHQILMTTGLTAPAGLAIKDNAAYVSNCSTCAGNGSVLRIPLP